MIFKRDKFKVHGWQMMNNYFYSDGTTNSGYILLQNHGNKKFLFGQCATEKYLMPGKCKSTLEKPSKIETNQGTKVVEVLVKEL